MHSLKDKITITEFYIKWIETKYQSGKIFVFWSGGKDSTVILHIIKNMHNDKVPFPVIFKDSTLEFPEVYNFIKTISKNWKIKLIWDVLDDNIVKKIKEAPDIESKRKILNKVKYEPISKIKSKYDCKGIINGIRWSEHFHSINTFIRQKDNFTFLYPILHFTENDIWDYTSRFQIPYVKLYDKGYNHF